MKPLLIYDGDCGFCTSSARWAESRWNGDARALPWQRADLDALGLTREEANATAWWIDEGGRRFHGHLAIAHSLAAGTGWSAALGRALLHPPFTWIGAVVYPVISRYRHRLPGGTPACRA
jgi:predicted DCC family thiol-disulfide oxidoreductase YuxK